MYTHIHIYILYPPSNFKNSVMAPRKAQIPAKPKGVNSFKCRVCRGVHALKECQRFLHLAAEKLFAAVSNNKYCPNILMVHVAVVAAVAHAAKATISFSISQPPLQP